VASQVNELPKHGCLLIMGYLDNISELLTASNFRLVVGDIMSLKLCRQASDYLSVGLQVAGVQGIDRDMTHGRP